MHFQQALRVERHHFTLSTQSSTVRWFKSEAGWNDLWGCLLSSIDYRKTFIHHSPLLVHPWCSGWRGRSGFQLQLKSLGMCRSGTSQVRQTQCPTIPQCSRAGWLSSCWHEQWWHTTAQLAGRFQLWERRVLLPTIFTSHWIPRAAGAKSCTLHKSRRELQGSNSSLPGMEGNRCHLRSLSVAMALGSLGFPASCLNDVDVNVEVIYKAAPPKSAFKCYGLLKLQNAQRLMSVIPHNFL